MSKEQKTEVFQVGGMICVNCENIIRRQLEQADGVSRVVADYGRETVEVDYAPSVIERKTLISLIEESGYQVLEDADGVRPKQATHQNAIGITIIVVALYMILRHFGLLGIFDSFPQAEAGMGYGLIFLIGLLTSVHCIAMCGGINLSQCIPPTSDTSEDTVTREGRFSSQRPSFLYNFGRVVSYTVIGGIVGALGSVLTFSGSMKGIVMLIAGVFMVIMGLNMLGVFPGLRSLTPRMPKFIADRVNAGKSKSSSPFYVGLLNGFMPCGPLQAMQLYALSTGSFAAGALSMFLFSLGTFPLMFGLGALSSLMTKRFTNKMVTVGAVLVMILGVFMFQNGMTLSAIPTPFSLGSTLTGEQNSAQVVDGVQTVTTQLKSGSYPPITVQAGVPVRWTIEAGEGTVNGCNNEIVIPEFDLQKKLAVGENVIEFTPTASGTFSYSCWMGMIKSSITVVEAI